VTQQANEKSSFFSADVRMEIFIKPKIGRRKIIEL
jgi:hypothetical protein